MSNSMSTGAAQPAGFADPAILERGYRKATWRLIPFIFICYLFNYLDRVNVGFAKLEMLDALKLSETVYGLGAGIFFIGYVTSGVPSNHPTTVGWLSALPYLFAGIFMVLVGRSADARRERRWHLSVPMAMALAGLLLAANFSHNVVLVMIGLTLATMGALTGLPMFWPLPAAFLGSAAAAGGLALINSLGQVAGFVSPFLVGWIKDATGSTDVALYILSTVLLVGAVLVMIVPARLVNR